MTVLLGALFFEIYPPLTSALLNSPRDARTWTTEQVDTSINFTAVTHSSSDSNEHFIAVGSNNALYSSSNGVTWSSHPIKAADKLPKKWTIESIVYAKGRFVITGEDKSTYPADTLYSAYSSNGLDWTKGTGVTGKVTAASDWGSPVKHVGNAFFITNLLNNQLLYSSDGEVWHKADLSTGTDEGTHLTIQDISYNPLTKVYVAVRGARTSQALSGQILSSINLKNWTASSARKVSDLYSIIYRDGQFIAVGTTQIIYSSYNDDHNKLKWTTLPTEDYLRTVAYDDGHFIAAGVKSAIDGSNYGKHWQSVSPHPWGGVYVSAYFKHHFILLSGRGYVGTSTNGMQWQFNKPATHFSPSGTRTLAHNKTTLVLVGSDRNNKSRFIYSSNDGKQWTKRYTSNGARVSRADYINGEFFVYGEKGTLLTSTDGKVWKHSRAVANLTNEWLSDVTYGNGKTVLIGDKGIILTHSVQQPWKIAKNPIPGAQLRDVTFADNTFVAVSDDGVIITSSDGMTWHKVTLPPHTNRYYFYNIAYVRHHFFALTSNGIIAISTKTKTAAGKSSLSWKVETIGDTKPFLENITYRDGEYVLIGLREIFVSHVPDVDAKKWK